ncbi:MAG: pilus assembly protein TadB [Clostridiales bacterium]|jgi:tight adherence protein B|nr:pilus assembly protein TadB [Clostridiales bacterium]
MDAHFPLNKKKSASNSRYQNVPELIDDYNAYKMSPFEYAKYFALSWSGMFLLAYVFYRNFALCLLFSMSAFALVNVFKNNIIKKRKNELMYQFRDALTSLASSLGSGIVIEKAFEEAVRDLRILYPYEKVMIIDELSAIVLKKKNGVELEESLLNFARRAKLPCVTDFVDVFVSANRTGGRSVDIVRNSITMINDKIEIDKEIETLVSGKKLEQRLLSAAPVGFVALLSLIAGDFIEPMFTTIDGHIVMTIVLGIMLVSYLISQWIMKIEL